MRVIAFIVMLAAIMGATLLSCGPEYHYEPRWYGWHLQDLREHLGQVKGLLHSYREEHGRYPTNDEGLDVLGEVGIDLAELVRDGVDRIKYFSYAELHHSGDTVLSAWLVPLLYENRRGLDPALFENSPVQDDPGRRYSIEVDEDVYVWSVGGRIFARELSALQREILLVRLGSLAGVALAVCFFVWSVRRAAGRAPPWGTVRRILAGIFGTLLALLTLLTLVSRPWVTCYIMTHFSRRRRPEMVKSYEEVLARYGRSGVISETTHRKLLEAVARDTALLSR